MNHEDLNALAVTGVGGYTIRTQDEVVRILQFQTVSGRMVNIALGDGLAHHVARIATDLELAAMESGETLRDLGMLGTN